MERRYGHRAQARAVCRVARERNFGIDGIDLIARSLCDSERDATTPERKKTRFARRESSCCGTSDISRRRREPVVTYAASTRPFPPTIEKEERTRARGSFDGPMVFQRTSAPALLGLLLAERKKGGTLRSHAQESNTREHTLCAVAPLAGRRSARTLGRAARLIEGPTFCKDYVRKKKRLRTQ